MGLREGGVGEGEGNKEGKSKRWFLVTFDFNHANTHTLYLHFHHRYYTTGIGNPQYIRALGVLL